MPFTKKQQDEAIKKLTEGAPCCICLDSVTDQDHLYQYGCCGTSHHLGCVLEWAVAEGSPVEQLICPSCDKEPEMRAKSFSGPLLPLAESVNEKSKADKKAGREKALKVLEETLVAIQAEVKRRNSSNSSGSKEAAQAAAAAPDAGDGKRASTDAVEQEAKKAPTDAVGPNEETIPGTLLEQLTQDL